MAVEYPDVEGLVVVDATGPKDRLNAEVWRHARLAQARGLTLVVEVYARSVLASRRLTEWWKSGDTLMQDTLSGVYLLRVDLQAFGPEMVLKLTPYAVVGAPLFVGWNPIGQVCSRTQFEELTRGAMALPLSAFVEDVLAGRPHSLNPDPSLGSAERTREAAALRRVGQAWAKVAPRRLQAPSASEAERAGASVSATPESEATLVPPRPEAALVSEVTVASEVSAPASEVATAPDVDAGGEDAAAGAAEPRDELGSALDAATLAAAVSPLDQLLANARAKFGALEDRVGTPLRFQVTDLRAIDAWQGALTDAERLEFAREFGAVLAIYVGDTIVRRVRADWVWDPNGASETAKLVLDGEVLGEPRRTQPLEWVVETLSDDERSLYGQVLAWCRVV